MRGCWQLVLPGLPPEAPESPSKARRLDECTNCGYGPMQRRKRCPACFRPRVPAPQR